VKVQSKIRPSDYWIRKIELNNAIIRLRKNIIEKTVENEGVQENIFEYDEVEVIIPNRRNLETYIVENFDALFLMGEKQIIVEEKSLEQRINELETLVLELGGII
jgi:hypothetical protein